MIIVPACCYIHPKCVLIKPENQAFLKPYPWLPVFPTAPWQKATKVAIKSWLVAIELHWLRLKQHCSGWRYSPDPILHHFPQSTMPQVLGLSISGGFHQSGMKAHIGDTGSLLEISLKYQLLTDVHPKAGHQYVIQLPDLMASKCWLLRLIVVYLLPPWLWILKFTHEIGILTINTKNINKQWVFKLESPPPKKKLLKMFRLEKCWKKTMFFSVRKKTNLPCRKMPDVAVFHLRSSRPLPTVLHGQGLIRPGARLEKLANHVVMLVLWGRLLKETIRNDGFSRFFQKNLRCKKGGWKIWFCWEDLGLVIR